MPWANGGGTTREVVAAPAVDDWSWRLSIADVAADGPFSRFPGVHRSIALLSGAGFVLRVDDAAPHHVVAPHRPFAFDGGAETQCHLVDGPVVDLNLMERGARTLDLRFAHLAAGATVHDTVMAAVVVAGAARWHTVRLGPFDALVATGQRPQPLALVGGAADTVIAVVVTHVAVAAE